MPTKRLTELEPEFMDLAHERGTSRVLCFECPACSPAHSIVAPFRGPSCFPSGAVWMLHGGEDVATATLSPSIDCTPSGCRFHGFVTAGLVSW